MGSQIAEGLQVIAPPRRPIPFVSWMTPLRVVKLIANGCFKGNPRMATLVDILTDYRSAVLAAFGYFLGCRPIPHATFMAICKGLELAAQLTLHLK